MSNNTPSRSILIDGTHTEETRVVVMTDDQLDEFEFESAHKDSSRGNVYVGEITRVEPSLQAAFISYGGNRNGFLAFSEIHPDYYDLPEDEKKQLLEEFNTQSVAVSNDDDEEDDKKSAKGGKKSNADSDDDDEDTSKDDKKTRGGRRRPQRRSRGKDAQAKNDNISDDAMKSARERVEADASAAGEELTPEEIEENARALAVANAMAVKDVPEEEGGKPAKKPRRGRMSKKDKEAAEKAAKEEAKEDKKADAKGDKSDKSDKSDKDDKKGKKADTSKPETQPRRITAVHRRFKMDEVIKAGQKVLVQIVKEERGTKGAALTTYVSLPGRFVVLMPNTPYAGGISRKITDGNDRRELKKITDKIKIPDGMGMIVRTAGVGQSEESITRDVEHLKELWKKLSKGWQKEAPNTLMHEDGSLLIRALRDMFTDEVDEVIVSGKGALKHAKDYMKSLMPEHAKKIKEYKADEPIFAHYGVEMDLHLLDRTRVNLPSGGYLIINPTEALVSIDVNSGRATQEKNIENTALATNIEAAHEIARQLRLRDLAGLVVIDFIDMEDRRNDRKVERAMREAVRRDRARTQIGGISDFGLMEMSRQRLHPSLGESNYLTCHHCQGKGLVRSPASAATIILRGLEEDDVRGKADRIVITANTQVAVYMLNYKRDAIAALEKNYKMRIVINADDKYIAPDHRLDLIRVSPDGSEKSQTIERSFREELDDNNNRKRRRNRKRKANNDKKQTRGNKRNNANDNDDSSKDDSKESNNKRGRGRRSDKNAADNKQADKQADNKQANDKQNNTKQDVKADSKADNKSDKPADKKTASKKPSAKKEAPSKAPKSGKASEAQKPAEKAEPKAEKPKPVTKPLMVEKIGGDNSDVIANQAKDDKKKSALQRWWNK